MTYQDLFIFLNTAAQWDARTKDARASKPSAFHVALQRVVKKNQTLIQTFKDAEEDSAILNAAKDTDGNLKHDPQGPYGYAFTPEGLVAHNRTLRALKAQPITPETFPADAWAPKDLSVFEFGAFEGFVLVATPEPELVSV